MEQCVRTYRCGSYRIQHCVKHPQDGQRHQPNVVLTIRINTSVNRTNLANSNQYIRVEREYRKSQLLFRTS